MDVFENVFLFAFLGELLLKMFVLRCEFFSIRHAEFNWNMFDFFVVMLGLGGWSPQWGMDMPVQAIRNQLIYAFKINNMNPHTCSLHFLL